MSEDKEFFDYDKISDDKPDDEINTDSNEMQTSEAAYSDYLRELENKYNLEEQESAQTEDVYSSDAQEKNSEEKKNGENSEEKKKNIFVIGWQKFLALSKGKKAAVIIASVLALIIIIVGCIAGAYLNMIDWNGNNNPPAGVGDPVLEDDPNLDSMHTVTDASGLNDYLQKWHDNNGDIMYSKNVINVLLLGLDESRARSDSMILLSVSKATKQIKMVSFYRDTYTYSEAYSTANRSHYMKLTEVHNYGGPDILIKTIEKDYKIKIDGYVSVNFETFPKVIDALGGVRVDVEPNEAAEMTNVWKVPVKSGKDVLLNGKQALFFCRIRYCNVDGDVSRTRRQRMVIESLINAAKGAKVSQIDDVLTTLLPSVTTSFGRMDFVKYATQAITYNWMSYPIEQLQMPNEENRTTVSSPIWYWIADFPACARDLQLALYGKTNIEIEEGGTTAMDFLTAKTPAPKPSAESPSESESAVAPPSRKPSDVTPSESKAPSDEPSSDPPSEDPSEGESSSDSPSAEEPLGE